MESCGVCDGTGQLLDDPCPLCDGASVCKPEVLAAANSDLRVDAPEWRPPAKMSLNKDAPLWEPPDAGTISVSPEGSPGLRSDAPVWEPPVLSSSPALAASSPNLRSDAPAWEPPAAMMSTAARASMNKNAPAWQPASAGQDELWGAETQEVFPAYDASGGWMAPATSSWLPGAKIVQDCEVGGYDSSGAWIPPAPAPTTTPVNPDEVMKEFKSRTKAIVAKAHLLGAVQKVAPAPVQPEQPIEVEFSHSQADYADSMQSEQWQEEAPAAKTVWLPDDLCWDWAKFGHCPRGSSCTWRHGDEQPRAQRTKPAGGPFSGDQAQQSFAVFVSGLNLQTRSGDIEAHFSQVGQVLRAGVFMDRESGESRGMGRVDFATDEGMSLAIKTLNNTKFNERTISVCEFVSGARRTDMAAGQASRADQTLGKGSGSSKGVISSTVGKGGHREVVPPQRAPRPEQRPPPGFGGPPPGFSPMLAPAAPPQLPTQMLGPPPAGSAPANPEQLAAPVLDLAPAASLAEQARPRKLGPPPAGPPPATPEEPGPQKLTPPATPPPSQKPRNVDAGARLIAIAASPPTAQKTRNQGLTQKKAMPNPSTNAPTPQKSQGMSSLQNKGTTSLKDDTALKFDDFPSLAAATRPQKCNRSWADEQVSPDELVLLKKTTTRWSDVAKTPPGYKAVK